MWSIGAMPEICMDQRPFQPIKIFYLVKTLFLLAGTSTFDMISGVPICPRPKAVDKTFAALFYRLPPNVCDEEQDILCRLSRRTLLVVAGHL